MYGVGDDSSSCVNPTAMITTFRVSAHAGSPKNRANASRSAPIPSNIVERIAPASTRGLALSGALALIAVIAFAVTIWPLLSDDRRFEYSEQLPVLPSS